MSGRLTTFSPSRCSRPSSRRPSSAWQATGLNPVRVKDLSRVEVQIADLAGPYLGLSSPGVITIDQDAAGYGWFIDLTPADDSDCAPHAVASPAGDHVDLLSVVCHELGHELGFEHDDGNDVMAESLAPGVRHLPIAIRVAGIAPSLQLTNPRPVSSQYQVPPDAAAAGETLGTRPTPPWPAGRQPTR